MVIALIEMEIRRSKFQEGNQEFCLGGLNWRCLLDRRQMDRRLESVAKAGHTDTHTQMPPYKLTGWGEMPGLHKVVGSDSGLLRRHCPLPHPGQGGGFGTARMSAGPSSWSPSQVKASLCDGGGGGKGG